MKFIQTNIFFGILLLIMASCNSDDSSSQDNSNFETEIIGVWNLIDYTSTEQISETGMIIEETGSEYDYTLEFKNNPKSIISNSGSYKVINNSDSSFYLINSNSSQQEGYHIGEWNINNGVLNTRLYDNNPLEDGAIDLLTEIVELSENSLVLKINPSQFSSDGNTITGSIILRYSR